MGRREVRQNKKGLKYISRIGMGLLIFIVIGLIFPTWTPKVKGENSICEFRKVEINGEKLQIMIRGCDRNNPILLFVHGGPCCSEIPYVGKYQKEWEEKFTIVHYDQRGSGKSFEFFKDYSDVTVNTHVDDLTALTEYLLEYLGQEKVILLGHSYGTYIGLQAASQEPEIYQAYVGIGQMSDPIESELDSLERCIFAAEAKGNVKDIARLKELKESIEGGEMITPRQYVRKYGFAARGIDDNLDYAEGFLLRPEYNLLDMVRFYTASIKHQDALIMEAIEKPLPDIVTEAALPIYFLMGKYDGMTSPEAAENYLNHLECQKGKKLVIFENSAHYPQFEERDAFLDWLCEEFIVDMRGTEK